MYDISIFSDNAVICLDFKTEILNIMHIYIFFMYFDFRNQKVTFSNVTFHILGIFIIMNSNTSAPNVTVRDI